LYIILRGRWRDIVLNACPPAEDKIDGVDRFYEALERVFVKFPKYPTKILYGDLSAEVGKDDIFKTTIGNESLHEISNDSLVRVVNFPISKNLIVKSTMFPHYNSHKFTWKSSDERHSQIGCILIGGCNQVYFMSDRSGKQNVILTTIWW
jgi:hypothetical protein